MVKIVHASINEKKTTKGGLAGDQTGKEVCVRNLNLKEWDVVLRPTIDAIAENSARIGETIAADENTGYAQDKRNTLWNEYKRTGKVVPTKKVDCDCSSFMTYCAILGGANIEHGSNAPTTRNMVAKFSEKGSYEVLRDKKYLESPDYLKRGDILVKEGSHTVMVLSNGAKAVEVSSGKISIPTPTLRKGDKNNKVKSLQIALNTLFSCGLDEDGSYGPKTEKAVKNTQTTLKNLGYYKSTIDGIYGKNNRDALVNYAKSKGYRV